MKHSQQCIDTDKRTREESKAWQARWPNACKECKGEGGRHGYTPGTLETPPEDEFAECQACLAKDICPRCGVQNAHSTQDEAGWFESGKPCPTCGWDYHRTLHPEDPTANDVDPIVYLEEWGECPCAYDDTLNPGPPF